MCKVLLIEDHQGYADILLKRLSKHLDPSFEVMHSASLRSGLESIAKIKFDVILADLSLPDSQGLQTPTFIRALAPEVPIVILTASDDEKLGIEAVRQGAQEYLIKGSTHAKELPQILQYAIERNQRQAKLRQESLNDALTGLYNRRGFQVLAEEQIKLSIRNKKPMLVVFADVNGLKQINDQFGHSAGDQALREAAGILKKTFRDSDVIARMGGDEFAVLGIDAGAENRENLLSRLRTEIEKVNHHSYHAFKLSLSVGVSVFDYSHPCSLEKLISRADHAMYENKRSRTSEKTKDPGEKHGQRNPKKILIVEDEPSISTPLAHRLRALGYEVTIAQNGEEGLEKVKQESPGLVILDLMLPELPGEEVCKAIRLSEDENLAQTPIIMLTAKSSDVDHVIGKVIGANCYMTKPFHADNLLKEIQRLTCVSLVKGTPHSEREK